MTTQKTRTSARQATARQRIAHRDSPAGSAPPFETYQLKWTSTPDKTTEKDLIVSMTAYLREDPTMNDDLQVFRFICRDWYMLEGTLHTRATMDTVKRCLLALGITRYIHRTPNHNWHYWNDYTALAIMDFYPMPVEQLGLPTTSPSLEVPPRVTGSPMKTGHTVQQQVVSRMPDSENEMDMTENTSPKSPSLETMPFVPPRHSTSPSGEAARPPPG